MLMNLNLLQEKLFRVARKTPPSDHVPFAFEKRIMAHLAKPMVDAWLVWGRALWRAAAACVVAMAILGGWFFQSGNESADLSQDFEDTVFAVLNEQPALGADEEIW